jgi:glucuronate isomerase
LPIISPHGHTDPAWFAGNDPFPDPAALLVTPDHYVFRMLHSLGASHERLGLRRLDGEGDPSTPRQVWSTFAAGYDAFRGTPSRLWLDWVFAEVFGLEVRLSAATADLYWERISAALQTDAFRPRALFDRFNLEVLATTESPLDDLAQHAAIRESGWAGRVITTFRPDPVLDPAYEGFRDNLARLSETTGEDALGYRGYLAALRQRRAAFKASGATATDHGHPTAATADLSPPEAEALFTRVTADDTHPTDAEAFRAHMLTVMAGMSVEDGLVMQLHPGSFRNHDAPLFAAYGRDKGADIPTRTDYVHALRPLLNRYGGEPGFTFIVFTLDETAYSRELAPLAGHYPAMRLGPPGGSTTAPRACGASGGRRPRPRASEHGRLQRRHARLPVHPARHDVARRIDCGVLAELVAEHQLDEDEAGEVAHDLTYGLAKAAYKL